MAKSSERRILLETILFPLVILGINFLFPHNQGFYKNFYAPYLFLIILSSAYYGKRYGYLCLLIANAYILGLYPLLSLLLNFDNISISYWETLYPSLIIFVPVSIVAVYIFGFIRSGFVNDNIVTKERFREAIKENVHLKNKANALDIVNREFEERVSKQQESITALYSQIHKMDTLNLDKVLEVLLETVAIFTKANSISIWRFSQKENLLKLSASLNWTTTEKRITSIPIDSTVEGWVYRNNSMFSVRMLLHYDNLSKLNTGGNIITLPINLGKSVWGILKVEEMPFEKYSYHTEHILQIIMNLSAPSVEKALEYTALMRNEEVDAVTKLPLYSEFYKFLDDEVDRCRISGSTLSVVIFEITNYSDLSEQFSSEKVKEIFTGMITTLDQLTSNEGRFFHYRNEMQLAMIYANLDFDGASLFCFEALEKINNGQWRIGEDAIDIEVIVGYASMVNDKTTTDNLLSQADNLLDMQKI